MAVRTHHKIEVLPKEKWIKDDLCKNCMKCKAEFTFFSRKHHCRCCGSVVCDPCSTLRLPFYPSLRICIDCYNRYTNPAAQQGGDIASSKKNLPQTLTSALVPVNDGPVPVALPSKDDSRSASKAPTVEESHLKKIPRFALHLKNQLGHGCYGVVLTGIWHKTVHDKVETVRAAVKGYPRGFVSDDLIERFVEEAESLASVQHPNIIVVYGMCTEPEVLIVVEWLRYGTLDLFLRRCNPSTLAPFMTVKAATLLNLSIQLADVMCYLEAHNILHRDLAARSVLVGENPAQNNALIVKLADFGLMRSLVEHDYYKMRHMLALPFKWMAPEIYRRRDCNVEAMVWSFGVLLWEIYSYGEMPFRQLSVADTMTAVERGERLEKPLVCPSNIFKILQQCWMRRPEERPYFSQIKTRLLTALSEPETCETPSTPSERSLSPTLDMGMPTVNGMGGIESLASAEGTRVSSKAALGRVVFPTSRGTSSSSRYLIGREKEMSNLRELFFMRGKADGRRKMVGLIGFSGVGKTCTAQQYAHHNSQAYPGGIYYIHAKSLATIQVDLRRIALQELGKPELLYADPSTIIDATMNFFNTTSGWLMILDNVDDLEVFKKIPLFPKEWANGHVLLTSRAVATELSQIGVDFVVTISPLKIDAACAVFWNHLSPHAFVSTNDALRAFEMSMPEPDRNVVKEMLGEKGVNGLPVAISQITASLLAHQCPVEEYSAMLTRALASVNAEYAKSTSGVDVEAISAWARHYHFDAYINPDTIAMAGIMKPYGKMSAEKFSLVDGAFLQQKFRVPDELVPTVIKAQTTIQDFDTEISISRSSIEAIWTTNADLLATLAPGAFELLKVMTIFNTHDVPVSILFDAIKALKSGLLYNAIYEATDAESPADALANMLSMLNRMSLICLSDAQPAVKTSSLGLFHSIADAEEKHPIMFRTVSLHRLLHMMLSRFIKDPETMKTYLFACICAFVEGLPAPSIEFEESFVSCSHLLPIAASLAQTYFGFHLDKELVDLGCDHGRDATIAVGSLLHFVGYWTISLPVLIEDMSVSLDQLLEISVLSATKYPEHKVNVRNIHLTRALYCFEQEDFVKAVEHAEDVVRIDEETYPNDEAPSLLFLSWIQVHSGLGFAEAAETADRIISESRVDTEQGRQRRRDAWYLKLVVSLLRGSCRYALDQWPLHVSAEVNRLGMGRENVDAAHPGSALYAMFSFWCGETEQAREVQAAIMRLESEPEATGIHGRSHSKYDRMLFPADVFKHWSRAVLHIPMLITNKLFDEAMTEVQEVLKCKWRLVRVQALACLANIHMYQDRHAEGMKVHAEMMELSSSLANSPWVALSLLFVADVLCVFQEFAPASDIYRRVIAIYDSFGHADKAKDGLFYAMGLTGLGRVTEAFLDLLVDSHKMSLGFDEPAMAPPRADMGLYSQAIPILDRELHENHSLLSWIKVKTTEATSPSTDLLGQTGEDDGNYIVM